MNRPLLGARTPAEPDAGAGGPQDRAPALEAATRAGRRSATGSVCRPRPCTRSWSAAGSTGSPTSTGSPVSRPPLRTRPARRADPRRCQEVRQHPRRRRMAVRRQPARCANRQATRHRTGSSSKYHNPKSAPASCTPSSTTTPASPTPRSTTTRPGQTAAAVLRRGGLVRRTRRHRRTRALRQRRPTSRSLWRDTCADLGIAPKKTRPCRPQTNGKIERFHRTLADGWAYKKLYTSEQPDEPPCQDGSTSTTTTGPTQHSGASPITRLDNLAGHHS